MSESAFSYDYIITGMGCAGLSLAVHLLKTGALEGKTLLLIDKDKKAHNDRTWCFWETAESPFESIVYHQWDRAWFYGEEFSARLDLAPYRYKMIRGLDYYRFCLDLLQGCAQVRFLFTAVDRIDQNQERAEVFAGGNSYHGTYVFNSIIFDNPAKQKGKHYLLQHFKGWVIETEMPFFTPSEATLMDFRPTQKEGTTFVYVMPYAENKALVEYTLFSASILDEEAYRAGLQSYVQKILGIEKFRICEEEFGIIPMTNQRFPAREGRIIHIGTAGGKTKSSSGYTFRFIQKQSAEISDSLSRHGHPYDVPKSGLSRFSWYDSVLLNILSGKKLAGKDIFTDLFRKNNPDQILRFLDNETSVWQELSILRSLPQWPFMKAGLQELFR